MQAQKSLSSISTDRDLWIAQYRQEMAERDHFSSLAAVRREGHKEGHKEGHREGLQDGIKAGRLALARKFMSMGHTAEESAAFAEIDIKLLKD